MRSKGEHGNGKERNYIKQGRKEANERKASNEDIDFDEIEYYVKNFKKEFVTFRKLQEIKDIIEKLI